MTKAVRINLLTDKSSGAPTIGIPGDRGCVSCGQVYTAEWYTEHGGDVTLVVDTRGRYWCLDCAIRALANVRRRADERTGYVYPWTFDVTDGPHGQHRDAPEKRLQRVSPEPQFKYVRLWDNRATVTCACGWADPLGPMPVSPFDPMEALVAAQAAHLFCPTPVVQPSENVTNKPHYDDSLACRELEAWRSAHRELASKLGAIDRGRDHCDSLLVVDAIRHAFRISTITVTPDASEVHITTEDGHVQHIRTADLTQQG